MEVHQPSTSQGMINSSSNSFEEASLQKIKVHSAKKISSKYNDELSLLKIFTYHSKFQNTFTLLLQNDKTHTLLKILENINLIRKWIPIFTLITPKIKNHLLLHYIKN